MPVVQEIVQNSGTGFTSSAGLARLGKARVAWGDVTHPGFRVCKSNGSAGNGGRGKGYFSFGVGGFSRDHAVPLGPAPPGAQALECYSCVQKADDGCSPQKTKTVKCAPGVDVCTEAVGAVETSECGPLVQAVCQPVRPLGVRPLRLRPSVCDSFPCNLLFRRPQPSDSGLAILGCGSTGGPAPNAPPADPSLPPSAVHGQFSVAVRGCGSGLPGRNDRGLDLYGMLAFIQLQQCSQDRCNAKLNLTSRVLHPAGNESASEPNGVECYSCVGLSHEACQGTAPPVVSCYNASDRVYKGCFDGNVTLMAANVTVALPVQDCILDDLCTRDSVTGPEFTLKGSCCQRSRCNSDLQNKTYFSPRLPPLVLMTPPQPTTLAPTTSVTTSMPPPTTRTSTSKPPPAPTSRTPPQEAEPEISQDEDSSVAGSAAGHQDRSNMGQYPAQGGPHNKGSAAPSAVLAALLLAVAAGTLL
ncbi:ly6/PLAUR domain-containing protein 3-like [Manis pentadactyla]|uniref:ly6/PLAUR domain-containing protein 3-like n=1 Tax=Manis pentadactyla TaxID=143292 RepID=UPI00255CDDC9|nr:ly6/PLAUR domain-containing protein 3-like [Manis pentadactyla]